MCGRRFVLFFAVFMALGVRADEALRLAYPIFKPFSYTVEGRPQGIGVKAITEIFSALDAPIELLEVPNYGRAVFEAQQGVVDGFFLASQNAERDGIGVFSEPVTDNNWMWFFKRGDRWDVHSEQFSHKASIGTFLHTNTHKWLVKNNFKNIYPSPRSAYIPALLASGKLDAALLAEKVFWAQSADLGLPVSTFESSLAVDKPFGIYMTHKFLSDHPGFMTRLNHAILQYKQSHSGD